MDRLGSLVPSWGAGGMMVAENYALATLLLVIAAIWVYDPEIFFGGEEQ